MTGTEEFVAALAELEQAFRTRCGACCDERLARRYFVAGLRFYTLRYAGAFLDAPPCASWSVELQLAARTFRRVSRRLGLPEVSHVE